MSRYNFKGDLNLVSERQLKYIGKILEQRNIKNYEVELQIVGKDGDNYMSNIKRVIVEENGEIIKMIAKIAPDNENLRQMANTQCLFLNEHVVYTEILPKYKQLQIEAGITDQEMFRHAECYGSLSEAPHEVIILEDLKESNFEMLNRFKPLSNEAVKLALKNFAIWHSLSFVLKHREPETYDAIKSKLFDMFTSPMAELDAAKQYFKQLEETTISNLDCNKYKSYIVGTISEIFTWAKKCKEVDQNSKYSVIRQGDGWTNNMMFRSENNVPKECVLIDYQLVYESSPAYDIMYMLFNSTDHEQRTKHYYEFIDHYHTELNKSLNNFGLKADLIYPRDQLDADLKRYGRYAFALSILIANVITKKPEEATKFKEQMNTHNMLEKEGSIPDAMFELDPETLILYRKKVVDLVDSFQLFGVM